jgi:hypothetical protein
MDESVKERIKATPVVGAMAKKVLKIQRDIRFPGSADYWERRYSAGGNSGEGSYGPWAEYKANVLNEYVESHDVHSVIEWGCGDGNQLGLSRYAQYVGLDVSETAIRRCIAVFGQDATKSFFAYRGDAFLDNTGIFRADMAMSLDVVYHLVEDSAYHQYMSGLFASADRFVVVYSTNEDRPQLGPHVRHREFLPWVAHHAPEWALTERLERPGKSDPAETDFYFFERG